MRFKRRPDEHPKGAPAWMVTFSDLVTLILVFFILLFSMSQIDMIKFKAIAESFRGREILDFNPSIVPLENPPGTQEDNGNEADGEESDLQNLLSEIKTFLGENGLEDVIIANRTERGVVLVLDEQVLFETGEAEIIGGRNAFLDKVGGMLKNMPNLVKVEGHTDNRPITTFRYPSNWELSTARSSSVIRYFVDHFQVESARFIAVGYGETRPIVPNDSPENWEKNRRVEIVVLDPKFAEKDMIE
ncbi:flagellar motor protein MotS [Robertmurraya andreesenii]|uniref:Chemotaxis protein MotB n=1 Tax=Anoxybacillus andreesenii TaxID=1325932 RepID=A0ABT9V6I9_9BACL|nr:flagellar motor protein MotS [Robertmurraya andreesenii]MDQ0156559.1 chemotaxis protein MotB [Robertmurraya andreesenii]